jgi:nucleoside-triphosphatase
MGKLILLTGRPGIGKTTVLRKTVALLRNEGWAVGGMVSSEIRRSGRRIGFEISDLLSGKSGILAHLYLKDGPQVGRYRVNLVDLERIGVRAVQNALEEAGAIFCDEIGSMELCSPLFREAILRVVRSPKPFVATVHLSVVDSLIREFDVGSYVEVFKITRQNRGGLHLEIARLVKENPDCRDSDTS